MAFIDIKHQPKRNPSLKLQDKLSALQELLKELEQHDLSSTAINYINKELKDLNDKDSTDPKLHKAVLNTQNRILKFIEKQHKIVPKGYYQQLWLPLGMSVFGIPMGVVFGLSLGNMAFLGIGLPIGMVIGMAVGASMDQKAAKEGRQLQFKSHTL